MTRFIPCLTVFVFVLLAAPGSFAQVPQTPPAPPPPAWSGTLGAGLALTSGNSETSSLNLAFKAEHDPKNSVIFKAEGLYIRGASEGELTADNAALAAKLERRFSDRGYAFLQTQYLRDSFKAIDYFIAPTLGVGYRLVHTERATLSTDASLGPSWEKNPGREVKSELVVAFGQKSTYALSKTATFSQGVSATLVGSDWADSLYRFNAGIAASLTGRTHVKVEVVDVYKNKPPTPAVKKNDVSTLVSVLYRF